MDYQDSAIDVSALEQMLEDTGDDPEFVIEIIGDFISNGAELIQNLQSAITSNNASEARRAAHSLKGNSASLGANRLSQLSAEMESFCKEDRVSDASRFLVEIEAAFSQARIALTTEQKRLQG